MLEDRRALPEAEGDQIMHEANILSSWQGEDVEGKAGEMGSQRRRVQTWEEGV